MVMKPVAKKTKTIPAGEFKAKCLQLMDEVNASGLHLVITKRGKPVADIVPHKDESKAFRPLFGRSKSTVIHGDIVVPLNEPWNADEGKWEPS